MSRRRWNTGGQHVSHTPGGFARGGCACNDPSCTDRPRGGGGFPRPARARSTLGIDFTQAVPLAELPLGGAEPAPEPEAQPEPDPQPEPEQEPGPEPEPEPEPQMKRAPAVGPDPDAAPLGGGADAAPAAAAAVGKRKKPRVGKNDVKFKDKPTPGRCAFFMVKKKRYCSMRPGEGKSFCGVHEAEGAAAAGEAPPASARARVPCPIDPSHTVFADQVKHHIKVCTGGKQAAAYLQQPYFADGLNSGTPAEAAAATTAPTGPSLPRDDNLEFSRQIGALYAEHVGSVRAVHLKADEMAGLMEETAAQGAEHASYRHLVQQASILGNMERVGILRPPSGGGGSAPVFVEFGAGRGMLSLAIREAVPMAPLLLVERGSVRNKADNQLRKQESTGAAFERLRVDIRDLDLRKAPMMAQTAAPEGGAERADAAAAAVSEESCARYVAVSKHLCGVATDLTLRCLHNATDSTSDAAVAAAAAASAVGTGVRCEGVAIALCCHHCMNWEDYVGKTFFQETLGLGKDGFDAIKGSVSWCTEACGDKAGMTAKERAVTGRRCKRLLDMGRLDWLRRVQGMEAELVEYCEQETSLENALLLAWHGQAASTTDQSD